MQIAVAHIGNLTQIVAFEEGVQGRNPFGLAYIQY